MENNTNNATFTQNNVKVDETLISRFRLATFENAKVNSRDKVSKKDRSGKTNLVARFRRTRKGEVLKVNGTAIGGTGIDGSDYYALRLGADNVLYCECPDYKFRGHKYNKQRGFGQPAYKCKHVVAALDHAVAMIQKGVNMDSEMIVYDAATIAVNA